VRGDGVYGEEIDEMWVDFPGAGDLVLSNVEWVEVE